MARSPTADMRNGMGQELPLPDSSIDAVFAAEAFHWYFDDQETFSGRRI